MTDLTTPSFRPFAGPCAALRCEAPATGEHGDLLDLIGHRIGAATLGPSLDEARAFLALPVGVRNVPEAARTGPPASWEGAAAADDRHRRRADGGRARLGVLAVRRGGALGPRVSGRDLRLLAVAEAQDLHRRDRPRHALCGPCAGRRGGGVGSAVALAIVKRQGELRALRGSGRSAAGGRAYLAEDVPVMAALGAASGFASVVILTLYIQNPETGERYARPEFLWLICPLLLYWLGRMALLAGRGEEGGDSKRLPDNDDPLVFCCGTGRAG